MAVEFNGQFFEQGALSTAVLYWKPGLPGTCQRFTSYPLWELGAELEKPADFVGPISVVAR